MRGVSKRKRLVLFIFLLLALFSCPDSRLLRESDSPRILQHVPFFPQEEFQCGPASLAAILNFWGIPITPEEIAKEVFSPTARGTLTLDMMEYPKRKGLTAITYKGSMEDLKTKIHSGYPLIVLVDLGFFIYQQNHFMVVLGYEENGVIAHSGKEPFKRIPLKRFMKTWSKTDFWTLWIHPLP